MWPLELRRKERERRKALKDDYGPDDAEEVEEQISKAVKAAKNSGKTTNKVKADEKPEPKSPFGN